MLPVSGSSGVDEYVEEGDKLSAYSDDSFQEDIEQPIVPNVVKSIEANRWSTCPS